MLGAGHEQSQAAQQASYQTLKVSFFSPLSKKMNFGFLLKWEVLWIMSTFNSIFYIDKLKLLKKNAPDSVSRNKKHLPA